MNRRVWQIVLWLGLGSAFLITAWLLINTTFMLYDDEGYVLLTYRNFIAGGRLYDEIFSQYGPWPYLYHWGIASVLNTPLTHAIGRNLTAIHWTLCALFVGGIAYRLTDRTVVAVFTSLATFGLLWQMSAEPSHPGSLIAATLAALVLFVAVTQDARRWHCLGAAVGLGTALLFLTKINIGVLFIAGAGAGALLLTAWPARWQRAAAAIAAIGMIMVPWGLMSRKLDEPWVLIFALQFSCGAAGLFWINPSKKIDRQIPPVIWWTASVTFVAAVLLISIVVCARGTSWTALLQAVLLDPLRHPGSFMIGFTWKPIVWPLSLVCILTTLRAGWELRRIGSLSRLTRQIVMVIRLGATLAFVINLQTWLTVLGVRGFIVVCLPLLPVFLLRVAPVAAEEKKQSNVLLWVACLALPQVLHAYPVAGSQLGWGTFLLVPVFVAGLYDAGQAAAHLWPKAGMRVTDWAWGGLLMVGLVQLGLLGQTGYERYSTSQPLDLPGAENIRPGDGARTTLRVLTLNAAVHADVLFSRPGMFSYNIWSGAPTPTLQNTTHWFWLLPEAAQKKISDGLGQTRRSAIIVSTGLDEFLESIHVPMHGPLKDFILQNYRPLLKLGSFEFLIPIQSRAVAFGLAEVLTSNQSASPTWLLRSNVVLDGTAASVELRSTRFPWEVRQSYSAPQTRILLEPINSQGDRSGNTIELPHPTPVHGLFRVSIHPAALSAADTQPQASVLVVLDPNGVVLSESVF